jgi:hypothetical protein
MMTRTEPGLGCGLSAGWLLVLLAACGPSPDSDSARQAARLPQEATVRSGDLLVRASTVPAESLNAAVAGQYGVARDQGTVLLLVGVRRATGEEETSVPARVSATAVDLLGKRQAPQIREVRSGDFIDYVGSFRIAAPETLRFDIVVVADGGQRATLQFNRDFFRP